MKKILFLLMAVVICSMTAAAQTVGVAVLTHNNENTMFYGNTALQQAVEAATDGDVISLSPGTFVGFQDFSKSGLTIIGSGMDEGPSQTILTNFGMEANKNDEKFAKLTLKNVLTYHFSAHGSYDLFLEKIKCSNGLNCSIAEGESSNIEMTNCIIDGQASFSNCKLKAYNCVLFPTLLEGDETRERILSHCILLGTPTQNSTGSIHSCIIIENYQYAELPTKIRATNCKALIVDGFKDYLGWQTQTNERLPYDFDAFVEGSFYELNPELTSTWVDENGEQIGIYGGPKPFNALPDAPRFTKFNVPSRTDADGRLKVEVEIALPEK